MENNDHPTSKPEQAAPSAAEARALYTLPMDAGLQQSVDQLDALKSVLDDWKQKRPDVWPAILHKLKVRWTTDSNAIEGSTLTFAETLFFLEQGLTVSGKPFKDHLDARNHAEAIDLVFDTVANRRPISEGLIKELNSLIMSGVTHTPARDQFGRIVQKPTMPGQYKQSPNNVVQADGSIHYYVDPLQVAPQMQELCAFIESNAVTMHPAIVAAIAHYNFARIHPFDDGNGRGARILMNLVLMRAGFPPAVLPVTERRDYITALVEGDHGNIRPFVDFIIGHTCQTMESIAADFEQAPPRSS